MISGVSRIIVSRESSQRGTTQPSCRRRARADRVRARARAARPGPTRPVASISRGVISVSNDRSQYLRQPWDQQRREPAGGPVPRRSGRAAPASRPVLRFQPSGRAICLRPRRASWAPIRRSRHALSSAPFSSEMTAARPAVGVGLDGATSHESAHDRNPADRRQGNGPPLIGRHQRFHAIPDHQGEHRVRRVLLVARQRLSDRPAVLDRQALQGRGQAQPNFLARVGSWPARRTAPRAAEAGGPASPSSRTPHARKCSLG